MNNDATDNAKAEALAVGACAALWATAREHAAWHGRRVLEDPDYDAAWEMLKIVGHLFVARPIWLRHTPLNPPGE